jgi:hypothetical protein
MPSPGPAGELSLDAQFKSLQARLLQPRRLNTGKRHIRQPGQGRSTPQR